MHLPVGLVSSQRQKKDTLKCRWNIMERQGNGFLCFLFDHFSKVMISRTLKYEDLVMAMAAPELQRMFITTSHNIHQFHKYPNKLNVLVMGVSENVL